MKHLKNGLRAAVLAVALGAALPAAASAATGSIHGTVTKVADGTAIAQYTVELYGANSGKLATVCTDASGKYGFTGLATEDYYVQYSGNPALCAATGYAPRWYPSQLAKNATPIAVVDGADTPNIDTTLYPEATLSGTVTEAAGNTGLSGIAALVTDSDGILTGRACTAANGTYTVHRLGTVPYIVQFVADPACGQVGAYASRYYRAAEPNGAATAASASTVPTNYGLDTGSIDVRLALSPAQVQRTLTVTVAGSGSVAGAGGAIACPGSCSTTGPDGSVVTLTPTAASGSTFTGWTGACSGAGACSVTLDGDKVVGATFTTTPGGVPGGGTPGGSTPGGGTPGGGTPGGGTPGGSPPGGGTGGGSSVPSVLIPPTTPTPGAPTGPGTSSTPKAKCTVGAPSRVRRGRFTVKVRCDREAKLVVGGTVTFKRGKKTTKVKLATSTSTATTRTVSIKLPAKAARALKAKATLSAALTLRATTSAGTTTVGKKVGRVR